MSSGCLHRRCYPVWGIKRGADSAGNQTKRRESDNRTAELSTEVVKVVRVLDAEGSKEETPEVEDKVRVRRRRLGRAQRECGRAKDAPSRLGIGGKQGRLKRPAMLGIPKGGWRLQFIVIDTSREMRPKTDSLTLESWNHNWAVWWHGILDGSRNGEGRRGQLPAAGVSR